MNSKAIMRIYGFFFIDYTISRKNTRNKNNKYGAEKLVKTPKIPADFAGEAMSAKPRNKKHRIKTVRQKRTILYDCMRSKKTNKENKSIEKERT
ncbi:MAG: hypothetical protein ACI3XW_06640 [Butyricicoccus sp.]